MDRTSDEAFWLSISSFPVYNALIGYLLLRGELEALGELAIFTFALGVHFVVNDFALREHHKDAYDKLGRWIIAGDVVLNVFKEELSGERRARFAPFAACAAGYTALLQLA